MPLFAIVLALLVQDATPAPAAAVTTYAENLRCAGVLYAANSRLRNSDPLQPGVLAAIEAVTARLDARTQAGEVDPVSAENDLQTAVNAGMQASVEDIQACMAQEAPDEDQPSAS